MNDKNGFDLGEDGAERAARHAGEAWKEMAYLAYCLYVATHDLFTTEDVRLASPQVPPPPDNRAWGQVALRMLRENLIIATNRYQRRKVRSSHASPIQIWAAMPSAEAVTIKGGAP